MGTQMARLEKQLLQSVSLKPFAWLRFIDDIDMKWTHDRETLEEFLRDANNFHPTINDKDVFLDTTSRLEGDRVIVDLDTKPTGPHQYRQPSSCQPSHCSKNIPNRLALHHQ